MRIGSALFFAGILLCAPLLSFSPTPRAEAASEDVASLTAAAVSCVAGQYLAGLFSGIFDSMLGSLVGSVIGIGLEVPVGDSTVRVEEKKNTAKGYCLDQLFWAIAKIFLHQTRDSIVTWINSGFQGDPLYVTNYKNYFKTAADQEVNRLVRQIANSGSRYAEDLIISLVDPHYDVENLGDVLLSQCEEVEADTFARAKATASPTEYLAGDYGARMLALERTKGGGTEKSSGFLAQVGSLFAQADEDDTCGEGFHEDPVTGLCVPDGEDDPDEICGSSPEEKEARVDNFIGGDFYSGGWSGWLALTQNQQNNIYGKTLAYQGYAAQLKENTKKEQELELLAGEGFMSDKECIEGTELYEFTDEGEELVDCDYAVTTPGSTASAAIKEITSSSLRESEAADSIGEAIDAIIQALVNQLINQGLASLKNRGGGGGGGGGGTPANAKQALLDQINPRLASSEQYLGIIQAALIKENELVSLLGTLSAGITAAGGPTVCPIAYGRVSEDIGKLSQYSSRAAAHTAEIAALPGRIGSLRDLRNRVQALSSTADVTSFIAEFAELLAQFSYPNAAGVSNARVEKEDIEAKVTALTPERGACQKEKDDATASSTPPVSA